MRARHKQTGNKIFVFGSHAGFAFAAALLRLIGIERHALDIAGVGYGHHHFFALDKGFHILFIFQIFNFGASRRGIFVFDFDKLVAHNAVKFFAAAQNRQTFPDFVAEAYQFLVDFVALQTGQALQLQIENGFGLCFRQMIMPVFHLAVGLVNQNHQRLHIARRPGFCQQGVFGVLRARSVADKLNHRIEVFHCYCQTDQSMGAVAGFVQFVDRAPTDNLFTELDESGDNIFQIHHHRPTGVNRQHIHAEARLQRRVFVQLVQNHVRLKITLDFNHHAHALTVGLVADVGNALHPFFLNQFGNFLHHGGLVHLIGNFVNNDGLFVFLYFLNGALGAHHNRAAAGQVGRTRAAVAQNQPAGRKIRPRDVVYQLLGGYLRVVDIGAAGGNYLAQIVRRDVGGHADGNAVGAVDKQVRIACRQHGGLLQAFVIVGHKVDGVFVDILNQSMRHFGQSGLRITHGRRTVAVHGTEVSLTVHHRHAHRKRLRHPHHGFINRRIPVRVIFTQNITDNTGGFAERTVIVITVLVHGINNAAMHRL